MGDILVTRGAGKPAPAEKVYRDYRQEHRLSSNGVRIRSSRGGPQSGWQEATGGMHNGGGPGKLKISSIPNSGLANRAGRAFAKGEGSQP